VILTDAMYPDGVWSPIPSSKTTRMSLYGIILEEKRRGTEFVPFAQYPWAGTLTIPLFSTALIMSIGS